MAEKFENDLKYSLAVNSYRKAAEYFTMESTNSKSYEQQCLLKVADIMCQIDAPNVYSEAPKVSIPIIP